MFGRALSHIVAFGGLERSLEAVWVGCPVCTAVRIGGPGRRRDLAPLAVDLAAVVGAHHLDLVAGPPARPDRLQGAAWQQPAVQPRAAVADPARRTTRCR